MDMKAEDMFKKLGYKRQEDEKNIIYTKGSRVITFMKGLSYRFNFPVKYATQEEMKACYQQQMENR